MQNIQPYTKHTAIYKTYNHMQNIQPYTILRLFIPAAFQYIWKGEVIQTQLMGVAGL
jgi:hypothetical protein